MYENIGCGVAYIYELCASGESAVDTNGERLTIRHISTVSAEFAAEKYNERVRGIIFLIINII